MPTRKHLTNLRTFPDNVTTMLLLAPVTIDMAGILGVDPRPYLISEVSVITFPLSFSRFE